MVFKKSSNNHVVFLMEIMIITYWMIVNIHANDMCASNRSVAPCPLDGHLMLQADEYSKEEDGLYTVLLCLGTSGNEKINPAEKVNNIRKH